MIFDGPPKTKSKSTILKKIYKVKKFLVLTTSLAPSQRHLLNFWGHFEVFTHFIIIYRNQINFILWSAKVYFFLPIVISKFQFSIVLLAGSKKLVYFLPFPFSACFFKEATTFVYLKNKNARVNYFWGAIIAQWFFNICKLKLEIW